MGGVGYPKCKTCGKAERWHTCSGGPIVIAGVHFDRDGNEVETSAAPKKTKPVPKIAVAVTAQPALLEAPPKAEPVGDAAALREDEAKVGKRGRPRVVEDRQKYKAEKNRQYRAAKKGEAK